jgi:hypothetical protein
VEAYSQCTKPSLSENLPSVTKDFELDLDEVRVRDQFINLDPLLYTSPRTILEEEA